MSLDAYIDAMKKAKSLKFVRMEEYFEAQKLGINDPEEYMYAKRLGSDAQEWKLHQNEMQRTGKPLKDYIASVEKERAELKAIAEKKEAELKALSDKKDAKTAEIKKEINKYDYECQQYQAARNECAVASNIGHCMNVKLPMHPVFSSSCMMAQKFRIDYGIK